MDIFGSEQHKAREKFLREKADRENPARRGMASLQATLPAVIEQIVHSAHDIYTRHGEMKAVVDLDFIDAYTLVGYKPAEDLIKQKLEEFDPSLEATVNIKPDCSGNWVTKPELVVEFTNKYN